MAPFAPLFKHSFSTFDEQTYQHSPTPPTPCKHAPPPTFHRLIDSLSTTPLKTLWKTVFFTKTQKVRKGLGTSPFGLRPHYRAHPLRSIFLSSQQDAFINSASGCSTWNTPLYNP